MRFSFSSLELTCRKSVERVDFARQVTFIHGPVGTGKSSIARLIDFCLGGNLLRTAALRNELLVARLTAKIGESSVVFEREADNDVSARVSWEGSGEVGSEIFPLDAGPNPVFFPDVYTLSDLLFHFAGVPPIKVRKSKRDPDSPLVRLSFRDVMWYCYLRQEDLDSSFFQMEHPYKRNKSIDVMRFVVGFHSERLNELEQQYAQTSDNLQASRTSAVQIRSFLRRFELGSDVGIDEQLQETEHALAAAEPKRNQVEAAHLLNTHAIDPLRHQLQELTRALGRDEAALADLEERISDQESLRAELVSAKVKTVRTDAAQSILAGVQFTKCPQCGNPINDNRFSSPDACNLCGQRTPAQNLDDVVVTEVLRGDLNARIDELNALLKKHKEEHRKQKARVEIKRQEKIEQDRELTRQLEQYDSAFVSQVRAIDREIAELQERQRQLQKLAELPRALKDMERKAGELEGDLRNIRAAIEDERLRLKTAEARVRDLESMFLATMLEIGFPGLNAGDRVSISRRNWLPRVFHGDNDEHGWDFEEAGSGGKQVLFNVCYALAVHRVAAAHRLPLPTFLIVDSPTKNISPDVNPDLVRRYFGLIYELAGAALKDTQFLIVDPTLVTPGATAIEFTERELTKQSPLVSYYDGP